MNKEILKMIKTTIEEINIEKQRIEIEINRIYKEIWKDLLLELKRNYKQKELSFQLNDYIDQENTPLIIEKKIIEMLYADGFRCDKTGAYPTYIISTKKVYEYTNNQEDNNDIITKKVITPFAETRKR